MGHRRDDFKQTTKTYLAQATGFYCARCEIRTHYWCEVQNKLIHIGNAAHDAAARSGGPRFDAEMTPEQRRAMANGAWLCANCATLVDVAVQDFPPGKLVQMQAEAVARCRDEVYRMPRLEQTAYDPIAAAKGISNFQARVRGIPLYVGFGREVHAPSQAVAAIRDLVSEFRWLNPQSQLSAQYPSMVQVQLRVVESLQRIEREVTGNEWWFDQTQQWYHLIGGTAEFGLEPEVLVATNWSAELVRLSWMDVQRGLTRLAEYAAPASMRL